MKTIKKIGNIEVTVMYNFDEKTITFDCEDETIMSAIKGRITKDGKYSEKKVTPEGKAIQTFKGDGKNFTKAMISYETGRYWEKAVDSILLKVYEDNFAGEPKKFMEEYFNPLMKSAE